MLTLADCLEALTGIRPDDASQVVTEAVVDSRLVIPGALFVALPGERVDGHEYVQDAFTRGASFALVQKDLSTHFPQLDLCLEWTAEDLVALRDAPFCLRVEDSLKALQQIARFWRRKLNIRVIGVTGSVGKSTTKELIAEVLAQRYRTCKSLGNLNNEIGLPLTMLQVTEAHQRAVFEMGFYVPGEISFLCDIALPEIGVITNIGTVHAERAGSQEAIASGKAELVQALPAAPEGVAILNYDDLWVRGMAEKTRARVFYYGLDSQADLWADGVEGLGLEGIRFRLHYRNEVLHLRVPMIGRHSVHTALGSAAVGLVDGLTWQEIIDGLSSEYIRFRLVTVRSECGALILDDSYNASPESTLAALNLLDELEGRKVVVLGDMLELGPYELRGHELVGNRAAEVAQLLVTVGIRGRMIATAASRAGLPNESISDFESNQQVIEFLLANLKSQDCVLIKGSRGMHMDQIVAALEGRS